jgi:hypothetical protein
LLLDVSGRKGEGVCAAEGLESRRLRRFDSLFTETGVNADESA